MGESQRESKPRRARLTPKQRKLVRARVKNPDATLKELGQKAGYKDAAHVHRALDAPAVKETMREIMDAHPKLNRRALAEKLVEGLDATETRYFADKGRVIEERTTPDHQTRATYLKLAGQFNKDLAPDRVDGGSEVGAIVGALVGALDSARARDALQRTSIPTTATPTPPNTQKPPEDPAA